MNFGGTTGIYAVTLRDSLKVGDRIFTQSGIHGVITAIDGDVILLKVGDAGTELEIARWSIIGIDSAKRKKTDICSS